MRSFLVFLGFLAACSAVAGFGSLFEPGGWYAGLTKPGWTPPNWIFGPVWSVLYFSLALAGWLVWRAAGFRQARTALILFAVQLVLNALWSWIFFGLHRPGFASIEIVLLWAAILATLAAFYGIKPAAGLILVPYLAWTGFAAVLNFHFWRLNP